MTREEGADVMNIKDILKKHSKWLHGKVGGKRADLYGDNVASDYDRNFVYRIGETVEVLNFDTNRWIECAPGIHHYITREEAVRGE